MEEVKVIPYNIETKLIAGQKYISECGIEFVYDPAGNKDKPILLNNGIRLDHTPTKKDTGANNLNPIQNRKDLTEEEKHNLWSKAGTISQLKQKRRKTFQESMQMLLELPATKEDIANIPEDIKQQLTPLQLELLTQQDIIAMRAIELSKVGSDKHMVYTRDTAGDKPTDKQQVNAEVITAGDQDLLNKIASRLNLE